MIESVCPGGCFPRKGGVGFGGVVPDNQRRGGGDLLSITVMNE